MKKLLVFILPFLILFPSLVFINTAIDMSSDLFYPDFHGYYPFPITICHPECEKNILGITGSLFYWILIYIFYFRKINKSKYHISSAFGYSLIIGVVTFFSIYIWAIISHLVIPQTSNQINLPKAF